MKLIAFVFFTSLFGNLFTDNKLDDDARLRVFGPLNLKDVDEHNIERIETLQSRYLLDVEKIKIDYDISARELKQKTELKLDRLYLKFQEDLANISFQIEKNRMMNMR